MKKRRTCIAIFTLVIVSVTYSVAAWAACANPAGNEQEIIYNADSKTYQFCDGTNWQSMKSASPSSPPPLTPGGNDGEVQFNDGGAVGASFNLFWDKTNGRLAVRNTTPDAVLDVAGEIKIGSSGGGCNANSEGAIRYDAGSKTVKFCNGSSWTANGAVAAGIGLKSISLFTSDGTWNKPAGVTYIKVAAVGGGGGGAYSSGSSSDRGGGGGGGGTCIEYIDVSGVSSVAVTVGSGGSGGASLGANGTSGGTSSFGAYCSASGGAGGNGNGIAGDGGSGSGGHINIKGAGGQLNNPGGSAFGGRDYPYGSGGWGQELAAGDNGYVGAVIVWEYGT